MADLNWIPIADGCNMPKDGEEVLVTVWMDNSWHPEASDITVVVDIAIYTEAICDWVVSANGVGSFTTANDWYEGQPIKAIAWMPMPEPYGGDNYD